VTDAQFAREIRATIAAFEEEIRRPNSWRGDVYEAELRAAIATGKGFV
jgi:hypothetical protein